MPLHPGRLPRECATAVDNQGGEATARTRRAHAVSGTVGRGFPVGGRGLGGRSHQARWVIPGKDQRAPQQGRAATLKGEQERTEFCDRRTERLLWHPPARTLGQGSATPSSHLRQ